MKQFLKKILVFMCMVLLLVLIPTVMYASQLDSPLNDNPLNGGVQIDEEGPTVDFNTLTVDKTEINPGEYVDISFKVSDDVSSIAEVYCNVTQGNGAGTGAGITNDDSTGEWIFSISPRYAGVMEITDIIVSDASGNVTHYINNAHSKYGELTYMTFENEVIEYVDMSSKNVTVLGANNEDQEGPELILNSLSVDKTQVRSGEQVNLTLQFSDESDIAEVYCNVIQANGQGLGAGITVDEESNTWVYSFNPGYAGLTEITDIMVSDINGNITHYINTAYSKYGDFGYATWEDEVIKNVDLSKGNFTVVTTNVEDDEIPELVLNTLKVDKTLANVREQVDVSFQIVDDSKISEVYCLVTQGNGSGLGAGIMEDKETGVWTYSFYPSYYGQVEITELTIADENGNMVQYINTAHSKYGELTYMTWEGAERKYADLSAANFYVGIKDDETGIFVSGSGITEDTTLEVEIKEHSGDDYDKMKGDKHKSHGYYEIRVKGDYKGGHKFRVFFDVPWAKDGEIVRICHMKHDGTMQIEEVPAKDGKVSMEVSEFSPFLIEEKLIDENLNDNNDDVNTNKDTKLDSDIENSKEESNDETKVVPKTGDNLILKGYAWLVVLFVSSVFVIGNLKKKRR